jgi:hypothetical protein
MRLFTFSILIFLFGALGGTLMHAPYRVCRTELNRDTYGDLFSGFK